MDKILFFTGFHTCQVVVWDFLHQPYGGPKQEPLMTFPFDSPRNAQTSLRSVERKWLKQWWMALLLIQRRSFYNPAYPAVKPKISSFVDIYFGEVGQERCLNCEKRLIFPTYMNAFCSMISQKNKRKRSCAIAKNNPEQHALWIEITNALGKETLFFHEVFGWGLKKVPRFGIDCDF